MALIADYPNSTYYHRWFVQTFPNATYDVVQRVVQAEGISVQANLIVSLLNSNRFSRSAIRILEESVSEFSPAGAQQFFEALRKASATLKTDGKRGLLNGLLAVWAQEYEAANEHLRIAFADEQIRSLVTETLSRLAPDILQALTE